MLWFPTADAALEDARHNVPGYDGATVIPNGVSVIIPRKAFDSRKQIWYTYSKLTAFLDCQTAVGILLRALVLLPAFRYPRISEGRVCGIWYITLKEKNFVQNIKNMREN